MVLYISGPMSGIENYNYPAFEKARSELIARGYIAISPHDHILHIENADKSWVGFMKRDLKIMLDECDAIVMLPNWEKSSGANVELSLAKSLNYPVFYLKDLVI